MEQVTAFKSSDGKLFETAAEVEAHESRAVWIGRVEQFTKSPVCPYPSGIHKTMTVNTIIAWEAFKAGAQEAAPVKKTKIDEARLSVRTTNTLIAEQIEFVEDAQAMSDNQLLRLPFLGRRSLLEIRNWKALA